MNKIKKTFLKPLMFSLWLSGGIRNETDYRYISKNPRSLGKYCETVLASELFFPLGWSK